jgi:hypothetical protein
MKRKKKLPVPIATPYNPLARLKEPSTYAGLAVLGSLFGVGELAAIGAPGVAAGLAALAAIFVPG